MSATVVRAARVDKPAYRVPTMAEVQAVPKTGPTHVSTFSGCGGSCCGFALAGYRTIYANDCDPPALAAYRANWTTPIDDAVIQDVTPAKILAATGLGEGELDVFEGSPPCATFSAAGRRDRGWKETRLHAGVEQRNIEDLFFEWLRLLEGLRPRVFLAENVAGLARGRTQGYYLAILRRMRALDYVVEARVLDAQWLGVPQTRSRLFFEGVRKDLGRPPAFPAPLPYRYSVLDALPYLADLDHVGIEESYGPRHRTTPLSAPVQALLASAGKHQRNQLRVRVQTPAAQDQWRPATSPAPMIGVSSVGVEVAPRGRVWSGQPCSRAGASGGVVRRKMTIDEVKTLCSFPSDFVLPGRYAEQWERCGRAVPPLMAYALAATIRREVFGW